MAPQTDLDMRNKEPEYPFCMSENYSMYLELSAVASQKC